MPIPNVGIVCINVVMLPDFPLLGRLPRRFSTRGDRWTCCWQQRLDLILIELVADLTGMDTEGRKQHGKIKRFSINEERCNGLATLV